MLGACDREAGETAQEQAQLQGEKDDLAGDASAKSGDIEKGLDRNHAGELMPAVNLTDPAGKSLNSAALQGEPVLLNLWATWCAPCVKEMPLLDELAADYDGNLRVLTVSQDMDGAAKVKPFFERGGFSMLQPWLDPENTLGFALGGGALPVTVLYDAQGTEVWRYAGDYDWSSPEARGLIDEAIDG